MIAAGILPRAMGKPRMRSRKRLPETIDHANRSDRR